MHIYNSISLPFDRSPAAVQSYLARIDLALKSDDFLLR